MVLKLKTLANSFIFFRKKQRQDTKVLPSSQSPVKHPLTSVVIAVQGNNKTQISVVEKSCSSAHASTKSTTTTDRTSSSKISESKMCESKSCESKSSSESISKSSEKLCCDKCDGKHKTSHCPHYKKERGTHPDEQKNFYKKLGGVSKLPGQTLHTARVVRQPGDGSCLFHSMSYGLSDGTSASALRRQICAFIAKYPKLNIADTPLSDWIKWDSGGSVSSYVARMSCGAWGGGIEMACMSVLKDVNVHVYERSRFGYTRISAFDHPEDPESKRTVRVLYCGGVHYDAIVV